MNNWHSQLFRSNAPPDVSVDAALAVARAIQAVHPALPPVFSLAHLAHLAGVPYQFLRSVASRTRLDEHYSVFRIQKRSPRIAKQYRWIAVPHPFLLKTQKWINTNILVHLPVHDAAFAYIKDRSAYKAAYIHRRAKWLVKVDISNFFESILETRIYKIFRAAGYQPLLSFELSRICTRIANSEAKNPHSNSAGSKGENYSIKAYASHHVGHLPQGAPTSPMLANIVAKILDEEIEAMACAYGLSYSRYSDDIVLSTTSKLFDKGRAFEVVGKLYSLLKSSGFEPNYEKTKISGPGSKMIALGLLVDGDAPRLTSEFKERLRMHLYFCNTRSPQAHAIARKFVSVIGLKNHLIGLISYAQLVEPRFANECWAKLNSCHWPILDDLQEDDLNELGFYDGAAN